MEYWNCASCRMTIFGFLMFPAIFVGVEAKRMSMETVLDGYGVLESSESNESNVSNEATVPPAASYAIGLLGGCSDLTSADGILSNTLVSRWLQKIVDWTEEGTFRRADGKLTESLDTLKFKWTMPAAEEENSPAKKTKTEQRVRVAGSFADSTQGDFATVSSLNKFSDPHSIEITRVSLPFGEEMLQSFRGGLSEEFLGEDGEPPFKLKPSNTSRSGAAFFWSRNHKFILKTMPSKKEFNFLSDKQSLFDAYVDSLSYDVKKTSINPVLLSFQTRTRIDCLKFATTDTKYWVLMPVESVSTLLVSASGQDYKLTATEGQEMVGFDVKPTPIASLQRPKFFEELGERTSGYGFGESWDNHDMLMATITKDVEFLQCPTVFFYNTCIQQGLGPCSAGEGKPARLIDYSIFPMFQRATIKRGDGNMAWPEIFYELEGKLPRCLWKTVDFFSASMIPQDFRYIQVDFMCVAVIDYLMNWEDLSGFKRHVENNLPWIWKKWDDWGSKIIELFVCMSYPCAKSSKATTETTRGYIDAGENARVYEVSIAQLDGGRRVGTVPWGTPHVKGCHDYRRNFTKPRKVSREMCNKRCKEKWGFDDCVDLAWKMAEKRRTTSFL